MNAQRRCKRQLVVWMSGWGRGATWMGECTPREKQPNVIEVDQAATFMHPPCLSAFLAQPLAHTSASFLNLLWAFIGYIIPLSGWLFVLWFAGKACHECGSLMGIYGSTHGKTRGYSTHGSKLYIPSLTCGSGSAICHPWVLITGTCHIHRLHDQFWKENLSLDLRSGNRLVLAKFAISRNLPGIYIWDKGLAVNAVRSYPQIWLSLMTTISTTMTWHLLWPADLLRIRPQVCHIVWRWHANLTTTTLQLLQIMPKVTCDYFP